MNNNNLGFVISKSVASLIKFFEKSSVVVNL